MSVAVSCTTDKSGDLEGPATEVLYMLVSGGKIGDSGDKQDEMLRYQYLGYKNMFPILQNHHRHMLSSPWFEMRYGRDPMESWAVEHMQQLSQLRLAQ